MVQKSRRYAIIDVQTISEAALRPVSLVCGARGDRASSRAGPLQARGCAPTWASGLDDLTRVAAQRRHPKRRLRVSRDNSAMARRARSEERRVGKACAQ